MTQGLGPSTGVLLRPTGMRIDDRIALRRFCDDLPLIVQEDALQALRTDVTPDDVDGGLLKSSVVR